MPSLHLTNLVVSVPALLPLVTHLSPSSLPPPSSPLPPPWLHHQLPCDFGWAGAARSPCFQGLPVVAGLCPGHVPLAWSSPWWPPRSEGVRRARQETVMGHHLCFHDLSPWRCFGGESLKQRLEVNGSHQSRGNLRTLGLGLQVWGWDLLQRHLRGWDVASSTASRPEMQPSWEPPEAELSWLTPAPSHPTTPEDAACQDAGGRPGEGCWAPRTPSCWE